MAFRMSHVPLRLATGAFILNSGYSKLTTDDEESFKRLHEIASTAYPQFEHMEPEAFTRFLAAGEIVVGATLLTPFVSSAMAGLGLFAFSSGLLGLYLNIPGMRQGNSLRPSERGMALAKDSWLAAIGAALLLDGLSWKRK
jgi:DoxX